LTLTQKLAETCEYNYLLTKASSAADADYRLALVAIYMATRKTNILWRSSKPFNSLLGETYELVTQDYKFVAE
jgi:hypothetical protein